MFKYLFILLALLPLTLQKFCFDCWCCSSNYILACKKIMSGDWNYFLGFQCDCFLPAFPDLMEGYTPYKMCKNRDLSACCYHKDKSLQELECQCEYDY